MPEPRKKPCSICRRWFRTDGRVGDRQKACGKPDCQTKRRHKTQADWRRRNPSYAADYRLVQRAVKTGSAPETLRLPAPLNQLPWEFAKDQFGPKLTDFIGVAGALIVRFAKDQFRAHVIDSKRLFGTLPVLPKKTSPGLGHTESRAANHATGISPARPTMGAPPSPPTGGEDTKRNLKHANGGSVGQLGD